MKLRYVITVEPVAPHVARAALSEWGTTLLNALVNRTLLSFLQGEALYAETVLWSAIVLTPIDPLVLDGAQIAACVERAGRALREGTLGGCGAEGTRRGAAAPVRARSAASCTISSSPSSTPAAAIDSCVRRPCT